MREKWIVGTGGSEMDCVNLQYCEATEEEIKEILVNLVLQDKETANNYDYGTESVDEVQKDWCGNWYAYANHYNAHVDFSARKLSDMIRQFDRNKELSNMVEQPTGEATTVYHVEGYMTIDVKDGSNDEILESSNEIVGEADFGPLHNIEWQVSSITHADGERVEYR